jgi:hypothetical protein
VFECGIIKLFERKEACFCGKGAAADMGGGFQGVVDCNSGEACGWGDLGVE